MEYSAKSNLKKIGLELGGKSPLLLLASYGNVERAVIQAAGSIFFNQGEMCTAPSRLIVEKSVHERAVETIGAPAGGRRRRQAAAPAEVVGVAERAPRRARSAGQLGCDHPAGCHSAARQQMQAASVEVTAAGRHRVVVPDRTHDAF